VLSDTRTAGDGAAEQAGEAIYTVGHSNHAIEKFLDLLRMHEVEAVVDVRSHPYSRFNPQFSQKRLSASLEAAGVAYLFLGRDLGARSDDPSLVVDGKVDYGRLAKTARFQDGVARVAQAASQARVALLCAERDPLECHRAILVCPELAARGIVAHRHIREDGRIESRAELEARLLEAVERGDDAPATRDLFDDHLAERDARLARAYRRRGRQLAFAPKPRA
jgi:uncharacterized protein (DUF488 family)